MNLQAIADAYTRGDHRDDICAEFDLTLDELAAIRREHGLRRGKACLITMPDDPEEASDLIAEIELDALVEKKARQKVRRATENAARSWLEVERTLEKASELYSERWSDYSVPRLGNSGGLPEAALIVNAQDWHIGKQQHDGQGDLDVYISQLIGAVRTLIHRARRQAKLTRAYLVLGGDFLHVDNVQGTTTAGTPQDLITTPEDMLVRGQALAVEVIDLLRQAVPHVEVIYCRGNHDAMLSLAVYTHVKAWYRSCPEVTCAADYGPRQYRSYGDHLFVFTHGDMNRGQAKLLPQIAADEARSMYGHTRYSTIWTGHLHFEAAAINHTGVLQYQTPSPAAADRWHKQVGYVGTYNAIQGVIVPPDSRDNVTITVGV